MSSANRGDFFLYEQLCALENIASQYTAGREACPGIRKTAEEIASQRYSVAVVGEFKRGKSSLINALLGTDILPTDILPTTAAVIRVVYGTEQQIVVQFRDGHSEGRTLTELTDFATKLSKQQEETALSIREVVVSYPSILCKNHIEILDTPGLNENESMSEVTLSVIGEVDAAVMVTSAREPLSLTEQDLLLDLIAQPGIRHIVFAVTFIDDFKTEAQKDRVIDYVGSRIRDEALPRAETRFADTPGLLEKARSILTAPDLYGVSSQQARAGFTSDDEDLIEESRLPKFKEDLLALLTAAQTADLPPKTRAVADQVAADLPKWRDGELERIAAEQEQLEATRRYIEHAQGAAVRLFQRMDADLERYGLYADGVYTPELERVLLKEFITALAALTGSDNTTPKIRKAVQNAADRVRDVFLAQGAHLEKQIGDEMARAQADFTALRSPAMESDELGRRLDAWRSKAVFPTFQMDKNKLLPAGELKGVNVIPTVKSGLVDAIKVYGSELTRYIASWRLEFFRQVNEDRARYPTEALDRAEQALRAQSAALEFNYDQHLQKVQKIQTDLKEETT